MARMRPIQEQIKKSRITLTYRTSIEGQPAAVNLPLRLMVMGDFSKGKSADAAEKEIKKRPVRPISGNNFDDVMQSMKINNLQLNDLRCYIPGLKKLDVKLSFDSLKSFSPEEIIQQVPELRALLLMKTLLSEMSAEMTNNSEVRQDIRDLYASGPQEVSYKKLPPALQAYSLKAWEEAGKPADAPSTPAQPTATRAVISSIAVEGQELVFKGTDLGSVRSVELNNKRLDDLRRADGSSATEFRVPVPRALRGQTVTVEIYNIEGEKLASPLATVSIPGVTPPPAPADGGNTPSAGG
ncbi:MAG: type VI secretion system contractile sheath small subunit [Myxococcota bacterium]